MSPSQQEYAAFILRELVAEADNGHVKETSAVVLARQWIELEDEPPVSRECDETCAIHAPGCDGFCDHWESHENRCLSHA